jgi:hypothetical protein
MERLKNSYLFKRLKSKYYSFLFYESTPPPVIYFLFFAYFHFAFEPITASFTLLFFAITVKLLLVTSFNCLFMIAPFFRAHPLIAVPMLAVSLFACN